MAVFYTVCLSAPYQMPCNERFSSDYQYKIQTLLQTITPYIVSKYKEAPRETRNANFSLAYSIKMGVA